MIRKSGHRFSLRQTRGVCAEIMRKGASGLEVGRQRRVLAHQRDGHATVGGQRLYVSPKFDLVVVTTFGNYDTPDQGAPPLHVLLEVVLPAMR